MIAINSRVHANHMPLLLLVQEQPQQYIPSQAPEYTTHPDEVLYHFKGMHPITEGTNLTEYLACTTVVQAVNFDYVGNKVYVPCLSLFYPCVFVQTTDAPPKNVTVKAAENFMLCCLTSSPML